MHVRRHDDWAAAALPHEKPRQAYSRVTWTSGGSIATEDELDDDVIIVDVQGPSTKCTAGKRWERARGGAWLFNVGAVARSPTLRLS